MKQLCTAINKIVIMGRELGKKPILSWGNSSGDYPMFHYTNIDNTNPHISFCLLCDDTTRELGNPQKADRCRTMCEQYSWVPVSMRDEWATIYGDGVEAVGITSMNAVNAGVTKAPALFNLSGQSITQPYDGDVYIENGVKKIK